MRSEASPLLRVPSTPAVVYINGEINITIEPIILVGFTKNLTEYYLYNFIIDAMLIFCTYLLPFRIMKMV